MSDPTKMKSSSNATPEARAATEASAAWQPWRSYAVVRAWARLLPEPSSTLLKT